MCIYIYIIKSAKVPVEHTGLFTAVLLLFAPSHLSSAAAHGVI